jgi:hypothetical protein
MNAEVQESNLARDSLVRDGDGQGCGLVGAARDARGHSDCACADGSAGVAAGAPAACTRGQRQCQSQRHKQAEQTQAAPPPPAARTSPSASPGSRKAHAACGPRPALRRSADVGAVVVIVSVVVADLPPLGVTVCGLKLQLASVGKPLHVKLTTESYILRCHRERRCPALPGRDRQ